MSETNFPITDTEEMKNSKPVGFPLAGMLFLVLLLILTLADSQKNNTKPAAAVTAVAAIEKPAEKFSPPPELSAHAYLVKFLGEEKPLFSRREWKPMPPASLTKLMTALIAAEKLSPDEWFPVSPEARKVPEKRSRVKAGESLARDDLIRLALVSSANDAAYALAEATGRQEGTQYYSEAIARFVDLMNSTARSHNLQHTNFDNPTGLDADSQLASASDLATFAEYIWNTKKYLWDMTRAKEITLLSDASHEYDTESTNELLDEFPRILGGKTGFTDKARGNLMLLYSVKNGKIAIVVILGSENRFDDGRTVLQWLDENFINAVNSEVQPR